MPGTSLAIENALLREAERQLRHLDYGMEMAQLVYGDKARQSHAIWALIVEAVDLQNSLPDQDARFHRAGKATNFSPPMSTGFEARLAEVERLLMTGNRGIGSSVLTATPPDHERMLDVLGWLSFINVGRDPRRMRRAVLAMAQGGDSGAVRKVMGNHRMSRAAVHDLKVRAIRRIQIGLEEKWGIYLDGDGFSLAF